MPTAILIRFVQRALPIAPGFAFASLMSFAAVAQTPFVPDEWKFGQRATGSSLTYCVDQRDPDWPVARDVGRAIVSALLLEPVEHLVETGAPVSELNELYLSFRQTCDLYMGFKLLADTYPNWMVLSRGYYSAAYVTAVRDPDWKSLSDMPTSNAIAAAVGTSADFRVTQFLLSLSPERRWQRIPMMNDEAALRALLRGAAGAALVWAPSLWSLSQRDPDIAALKVVEFEPLPVTSMEIAVAMLDGDAFLRSNVDKAIESLTNDGTLQGIIDAHHFPARTVR